MKLLEIRDLILATQSGDWERPLDYFGNLYEEDCRYLFVNKDNCDLTISVGSVPPEKADSKIKNEEFFKRAGVCFHQPSKDISRHSNLTLAVIRWRATPIFTIRTLEIELDTFLYIPIRVGIGDARSIFSPIQLPDKGRQAEWTELWIIALRALNEQLSGPEFIGSEDYFGAKIDFFDTETAFET